MPHVIGKLYPGRSGKDKAVMGAAVAEALHETMGYDVANVSVAIEEIEEENWMTQVYEPEILGRLQQLVKAPSYGPLSNQVDIVGRSRSLRITDVK